MHVFNGGRPVRPGVGFSDALWGLLVKSWRGEHERPPISQLRAQLEKDGRKWVSAVGVSGAAMIAGSCLPLFLRCRPSHLHSPQGDDTTQLSPASDTDPDLQVWLKQAQELLLSVIPASTPAVPGPSTVPSPVIPSPSAPANRNPPQGPKKGVRARTRRGFRKFRDRFKRLLAKFTRASRGPMTLSRGLVPEREENAELADALFSHVQSDGELAPL